MSPSSATATDEKRVQIVSATYNSTVNQATVVWKKYVFPTIPPSSPDNKPIPPLTGFTVTIVRDQEALMNYDFSGAETISGVANITFEVGSKYICSVTPVGGFGVPYVDGVSQSVPIS